MAEQIIAVSNRAGIHARPAALLVQAAQNFQCDIFIEKGRQRINGKSILGIITLGAAYKTELKIITEGEDADQALDVLIRLFNSKFEEES